MAQKNVDYLRQFIAPFIDGANAQAILGSLGDEDDNLEKLTVSVNNQLSISTAADIYLDKLLAVDGLVRPAELGMEDLAFQQMGIQVDANRQISEVIHTVLATFYGDESVRAYAQSTMAEPFLLQDGMDLQFQLEDEVTQTCTFSQADFGNINQATAAEVSDVLTRFLRNSGYGGFALPFLDVETGDTLVRIFGAAKGPYSLVRVVGGKAQTILRFPTVRGTELSLNNTVWEITRTVGSTIRFRWSGSGSAPALDKVFTGDQVLIYGGQFQAAGLSGTYAVTNVRPAQPVATYDSGWFEFEKLDFNSLRSSQPNVMPNPNQAATPWSSGTSYPQGYIVSFAGKFYESLVDSNLDNQPDATSQWVVTDKSGVFYTLTLSQANYADLMFFLGKKNTPYTQTRYALAWEPGESLLKIYLPATTKVVKRGLVGSAHLHSLYPAGNLDGAFGSATDVDSKIEVVNEYAIRYPQQGFDNQGFGGTLTWGSNVIDVDYAAREDERTTVICSEPHGITGVPDSYGRVISNTIVTVALDRYDSDDVENAFVGPYAVDPAAGYALSPTVVTTKERVLPGESRTTLFVKGAMPNAQGELWFDLNRDSEEGPVRYLGSQLSSAPTVVNIVSISQNGTNVTVITDKPHGAIPNSDVLVAGTVNFNGTHQVATVPSATVYTFSKTPPAVVSEMTGTASTLLEGTSSTLIMDPAYQFKFEHAVGSDVTLLEDTKAYQPVANGLDYPPYITGTADGRVFVQQLLNDQILAAGIKQLEIIVVYPSDVGLGNEGLPEDENVYPHSEAVEVWGQ